MAMSDLPNDLVEEIISRVPVKSIRAVSSTCKNWNTLSNDHSFTRKLFGKTITTKENECLVVMMMDSKVYLMSVNLHRIHKENDDNNIKSSIMHKAKLISLNDDDILNNTYIIFHCNGLLLLLGFTDDGIKLVVTNPHLGQTRWIKPRKANYQFCDKYAIGYEKKKNNSLRTNKMLLFHKESFCFRIYWFEIYNFNSASWNVFYFTRDWELPYSQGVSLKGNTYWFAREINIRGERIDDPPDFLICFDFTTERFGPRLHLPFHSHSDDTVILSSVREEQLAVLIKRFDLWRMEIWVTTKIEPKEVSWNKLFLAVDMIPLITAFQFCNVSFFIDEKKNVVVVLGKDVLNTRNIANIIGNDGYFKQVDLGESTNKYCYPLVCSYVPSSVQIKQATRVMHHHHSVLRAVVRAVRDSDRERKLNNGREHKISRRTRIHERILFRMLKLDEEAIGIRSRSVPRDRYQQGFASSPCRA
ncbi:putative F-box protein [Arabidopsis thaliana]|uniref:F-box domain-containing protein n=2 Tax=Arabidopsis TaxID=3701 RepID=A0A178UF17_ARATH|nr:F-box domain [Arabidopsis thaliana x Arabidopsis arenosa]OAO91864.1 hypothetical protein AXX17_AT5G33540 [Arabidopsis thaliana]